MGISEEDTLSLSLFQEFSSKKVGKEGGITPDFIWLYTSGPGSPLLADTSLEETRSDH